MAYFENRHKETEFSREIWEFIKQRRLDCFLDSDDLWENNKLKLEQAIKKFLDIIYFVMMNCL